MTSSTDVMVASQKTTNHKMANRHVTIGDSTITTVSSLTTPDTPESEAGQTFVHTTAATSSTTTTTAHGNDSYTEDLSTAPIVHQTKHAPRKDHIRQPREEYYDVLHPEPRDQTNNPGDHVEELQLDTTQAVDSLVSRDLSSARYVIDPLTGWPLRRSDSLESRDNPFLPGGDLSREAEDLLSRATIIRDHFYLNEEEKRTLRQQQQQQEQEQEQEKQHRSGKHVQIVENPEDVAHARSGSHPSRPHPETVEERISPQVQANNLDAAAPASSPNGDDNHQLRPKENGRFKEVNAAPDNDRQAVSDGGNQSPVPGHTEVGSGQAQMSGPGDLQVREADKKKRNKCCTIM